MAKAEELRAAGIGQGQIDLALETSTGLRDILAETGVEGGEQSMKAVYDAFAGAAGPGKGRGR